MHSDRRGMIESEMIGRDVNDIRPSVGCILAALVFLGFSHLSLHLTRTRVRSSAMSDSEASSAGGESTPPSSAPSPELFRLTLAELTEENKEKAAKIKVEANKAFVGTFYPAVPPSVTSDPCIWHLRDRADTNFGFSGYIFPFCSSRV